MLKSKVVKVALLKGDGCILISGGDTSNDLPEDVFAVCQDSLKVAALDYLCEALERHMVDEPISLQLVIVSSREVRPGEVVDSQPQSQTLAVGAAGNYL